jgi:Ig-like domain CHU_C associated/Secretion system C-terminal sorting domain
MRGLASMLALLAMIGLPLYQMAQTTFNYTGAVQTYTVPVGINSISIDASGAQGGGSNGGAGGLGARMTGTFSVTPGQVLSVVVGQQGLLQLGGNAQNSSGGGGGSFVYAAGPTLLVAAGGGGGKCNYTGSVPLHAGAAGQVTTAGGASSDGNAGGTAGAGGNAGLWSSVPCAGGGTGWLSNGGGPYGGLGFSTWTGGPGYCGGGGGGCGGVGGFGGGGGGGNHYGGGGGGGGYSGGGGGTDPTHGGGGGSFSTGTAQANTAGFKTGNGQVIITPLAIAPCATPTGVTASPATICINGSSNLSAISSGNTINWYTQMSGGVAIGSSTSGANFAVTPAATTTYYAEATGSGSGTQTFNYTGAVQSFTVPPGVTSMTIDASGAQGGGSNGGAGGLGARMQGTFAVTPGQVLSIVVGQQGLLQQGGNAQNSSGGGGGTFVYGAGPTLLVAAGGGGGKCNYTGSVPLHAGAAGQVTTAGGASSDGNAGGTAGAGGNAGLWSSVPCAGGGTGWLSNGGGPYGGLGFSTWTGGPGYCGGGGGGCGGVGGFGGGGGGGNHYGGGGGGGGYSGGGGGTDPTHGGGGGSFSIGTAQANTAGFKAGDGQVVVTWSGSSCTASPRVAVTVTVSSVSQATNLTATPATICPGGSSDLSATSIANIDWYTQASGGVAIGSSASGAPFSVSPTTTTTYYAEAVTSAASGTQTFNYTGAVQTFTVPSGVTSINIDASGAQGGGSNGGAGGLGARMTGAFAVTPGQVLSITVGQQGLLQQGGNAQNSSGGGGGTFVYTAGPNLLVAAGGGGGKCNYTGSVPLHADAAGQITANGGASSDGNAGGSAGNGGNAGLWSSVPCAGGGTGWLSNGGGPYGGLGYNTWTGGPGYCGGGGGGCGGVGGFGGGGGGGNHYGGGGGGGGYSGGGGGTDPTHGGGGGSFSIGTAQVNTAGFKTGNGQVIITWNGSGCAASTRDSIVVTVGLGSANALIVLDTTVCGYNVSCNGASDGVATVTASGGCPSYTYLWDNGATTATATGLAAGVHTVTVTEGAGLITVQTVVLQEPSAVQATGTSTSSCAGDSTGTIDLTATGGNNCQGYAFLWSNGANTEDLANLSAGTYTVTVTDAEGCTTTQTITVGSLAALNPTISQAGNVLTSGQVWASYQWLLNGSIIPGATASSYTATQSGSYSLLVTDANGCAAETAPTGVIVGVSKPMGDWMDLSIYPNPARSEFRLRTANPIGYAITVTIHDLAGHRLFTEALPELGTEVAFDLKAFAAGTYLVEVTSEAGQRKLFRLVVQ